jgi:transcriptional regulator with PAS, ATPase and Fis domain
LLIYDWPGNIRELENTVEFMINMMDMSGIITHDILPQKFFESTIPLENYTSEDLLDLAVIEKNTIEKALKKYGNHAEGKKIASDKLGIGIATLYRKISKYGL